MDRRCMTKSETPLKVSIIIQDLRNRSITYNSWEIRLGKIRARDVPSARVCIGITVNDLTRQF